MSLHRKFFVIFLWILFVSLLYWPFFGSLSYSLFPETLDAFFALFFIVAEIAIAVTVLFMTSTFRKVMNPKIYYTVMIAGCVLFSAYVLSIILCFAV